MNDVKEDNNNSLESIKNLIKENLTNASQSFVAIGYYLKQVRNRELYKEDGCKDIWEFAKNEFGLSMSSASRFMSINDKFSVSGNSPVLLDEFKNFGSGKLQEMINMSDEQISKIDDTTTVAEIKSMKKAEKAENFVATSQQSLDSKKPEPGTIIYSVHGNGKIDKLTVVSKTCKSIHSPDHYFDLKDKAGTIHSISVNSDHWHYSMEDAKTDTWYEVKDPKNENKIKLSANDNEKTVREPGSIIQTEGCGNGKYSCFSCHRNCELRQKQCYCVEAPMGNPFSCTTLNVFENLVTDIGDECMFVNLDLAYKRKGDNEPVPCCKECKERPLCGYACRRATLLNTVEKTLPEDNNTSAIDYSKGIDSLAKEQEATGSCPPNAHSCIRNGEEGEEGKAICLKCWKQYLSREKILNTNRDDVNTSSLSPAGPTENIKTIIDIQENMDDNPGEVLENANESISSECESELTIAKDMLERKKYLLNDCIRKNSSSPADLKAIAKIKIEVGALACYISDLDNIINPIPVPVQSPLPILKNVEQRKTWLEDYKSWGEWYYDSNIDCHYYKYDFDNGDRIVVEEYRDREAYWGKALNTHNYFHLLQKNKPRYEKNRTYDKKYDHDVQSITEITEYLKDLQKK